mgnify:CR=1 FL=1
MTKSFELVRDAIEKNGDALFHCFITLPQGHVVKKNARPIFKSRGTGRPFIGKSEKLKVAELNMISEFRRAMLRKPGFKTIDTPLWAVFLFYFPATDFIVKSGHARVKYLSGFPISQTSMNYPRIV